jgi:hypothetical protein
MLHMMVVRQHNELVFKTWVGGWTNILSMAIPFPEGSVTKFTLVPDADVLQVRYVFNGFSVNFLTLSMYYLSFKP